MRVPTDPFDRQTRRNKCERERVACRGVKYRGYAIFAYNAVSIGLERTMVVFSNGNKGVDTSARVQGIHKSYPEMDSNYRSSWIAMSMRSKCFSVQVRSEILLEHVAFNSR